MSVMSSASVYSQDSWKPKSAFVPVVNIDPRRHAIAFSPSLQWSDLSDGSDVERASSSGSSSMALRTPPSASVGPVYLSIPGIKEAEKVHRRTEIVQNIQPITRTSIEWEFPVKVEASPPSTVPADHVHEEVPAASKSTSTPKKLQKKKENRISKHSKAFGKAITRLSMLPSKKEVEKTLDHCETMSIVHLSPEYKLPEFGVDISPMRVSFMTSPPGAGAPPSMLPLRAPAFPLAPRGKVQTPPIVDAQALERQRLIRASIPPPPIPTLTRSTAPPPVADTPSSISQLPMRMGHRRYKSSPAVTQFDFKRWDAEGAPPLPPMPPVLPRLTVSTTGATSVPTSARPRAMSVSMATRPHGMIRAVSPPFPGGRRLQ